MLVKRTMEINAESFKIGDVIDFELTDGEEVQAMAVEEAPKGMIFVLVDCLMKEYLMFEDIDSINEDEISYMTSDLRKALNGEILERFPKEIKDRMIPVNTEGDMLRIPTEREIFGENRYGQEEAETVKRWKPMKKKRNRIAFQGKEGAWGWYWLMIRHKEHVSDFANVAYSGNADYSNVGYPFGVRPVLLLKNVKEEY